MTTGGLPTLGSLVEGITSGDRAVLARAITLVESTRVDHQRLARELLAKLATMGVLGGADRIGITGVPGAGKSTLIERLGMARVEDGRRVAVLAVDPSSSVSGGSILGDKTRMGRLGIHDRAFIRPSPTAGTLGGVARRTREAMSLCEAARYDLVIVETVGVGQSEIAVAQMVDFFFVLAIAGAGDSLQGIKRGVLELADAVAINKADGANEQRAKRAAAQLRRAMALLTPPDPDWRAPVMAISALTGEGVAELWATIERHREETLTSSRRDARRADQRLHWMWRTIEDRLLGELRRDPRVAARIATLEDQVRAGAVPPTVAAEDVLAAFERSVEDSE